MIHVSTSRSHVTRASRIGRHCFIYRVTNCVRCPIEFLLILGILTCSVLTWRRDEVRIHPFTDEKQERELSVASEYSRKPVSIIGVRRDSVDNAFQLAGAIGFRSTSMVLAWIRWSTWDFSTYRGQCRAYWTGRLILSREIVRIVFVSDGIPVIQVMTFNPSSTNVTLI